MALPLGYTDTVRWSPALYGPARHAGSGISGGENALCPSRVKVGQRLATVNGCASPRMSEVEELVLAGEAYTAGLTYFPQWQL